MFSILWFLLFVVALLALTYRKSSLALTTLTLGAVIIGISLSMLHQSGLGALFLMAEAKYAAG